MFEFFTRVGILESELIPDDIRVVVVQDQDDPFTAFQAVDRYDINRNVHLAHLLIYPDQRIDLVEVTLNPGVTFSDDIADFF